MKGRRGEEDGRRAGKAMGGRGFACTKKLDCFSYSPISRAEHPTTVVPAGWLPSVPSTPACGAFAMRSPGRPGSVAVSLV